jgi:hypothetical protein
MGTLASQLAVIRPGPTAGGIRCIRFWATVALLAGAFASASAADSQGAAPGSYRASDFAPPLAGTIALLLHIPSNDPEFDPGDKIVADTVRRQTMAAGLRVGIIDWKDFSVLVRDELLVHLKNLTGNQALDVARAEARALPRMARIAKATSAAALLITTRLVMRNTEVMNNVARWDGQTREIAFKGTGARRPMLDGAGPGLSVEVRVHDGEGRLLLQWYGGAALTYVAVDSDRGIAETRTDLFRTPDEISQGVQLALEPLLGK